MFWSSSRATSASCGIAPFSVSGHHDSDMSLLQAQEIKHCNRKSSSHAGSNGETRTRTGDTTIFRRGDRAAPKRDCACTKAEFRWDGTPWRRSHIADILGPPGLAHRPDGHDRRAGHRPPHRRRGASGQALRRRGRRVPAPAERSARASSRPRVLLRSMASEPPTVGGPPTEARPRAPLRTTEVGNSGDQDEGGNRDRGQGAVAHAVAVQDGRRHARLELSGRRGVPAGRRGSLGAPGRSRSRCGHG